MWSGVFWSGLAAPSPCICYTPNLRKNKKKLVEMPLASSSGGNMVGVGLDGSGAPPAGVAGQALVSGHTPTHASELVGLKARKNFIDEKISDDEALCDIIVDQIMDGTLARAIRQKQAARRTTFPQGKYTIKEGVGVSMSLPPPLPRGARCAVRAARCAVRGVYFCILLYIVVYCYTAVYALLHTAVYCCILLHTFVY